MVGRRDALLRMLLGAGSLGLRSLATGLPLSLLANPRRALADGLCPTLAKAQFVVLSTSATGDPLNASVPGTYEDPRIVHSPAPGMAPTSLSVRGRSTTAARPWATLPQAVLDRTQFWHLATATPVHPKEPEVLCLRGALAGGEMFPSVLARQLAPCVGTIQPQPVCVGALTPAEDLTYGGAALPVIPPLALKATLASAAGPLTTLQPLRDTTMNALSELYRDHATPPQRQYLDALVLSQRQLRDLHQDVLSTLAGIQDNGPTAQVLAAVALVRLKLSPVIQIHIPFGGDNHRDVALAGEAAETATGVAAIALLMRELASAGLQDSVSLLSLNVFGRTLGAGSADGRQHNANHQVSLAIGKPFRGGIVGGVGPVAGDYGALPIDSRSGAGAADGDIAVGDSLAAFGQTMLAALGADPSVVTSPGGTGKVVAVS